LIAAVDLEAANVAMATERPDEPYATVLFSERHLADEGIAADDVLAVTQHIARIDPDGDACTYRGVSGVGVGRHYALARMWSDCGDHGGTMGDVWIADPDEGWFLGMTVVTPGSDDLASVRAILATVRFEGQELIRFP
jgi:hypothetical protein